jgi:hypothetical protein
MNMEKRNEIKVGDVVKSLDFVGVNDCYYVGVVIGISEMDGTFRARTVQRVWQGNADKKFLSDTFVAPLPGNHFFDDLADVKGAAPRVQVVWRDSSVAA